MKRIILILITLILCGCTSRDDFFVFGFDDYSISVGNDNLQFINLTFNTETPSQLEANQSIDNIVVYSLEEPIAEISITNNKNKSIEIGEAIVSKLLIYLKDLPEKKFTIDGIELDSSIKKNCETFKGTYIERNGYACVIEKTVAGKNNSIVMYGDYLNFNQDELDHLEISYE